MTMNDHYKFINERFDIRAGTLIEHGYRYKLVSVDCDYKKRSMAYFVKWTDMISASFVLFCDDLVWQDKMKQLATH